MKIAFVQLAGFRGCRESLRIAFPPGFAVITGRNGAGKSTICDAIEYAFTGGLSKYEEGAERGESVEDYIWWRGTTPRSEQDRYVEVGLLNEDGNLTVVRRGPGQASPGSETLDAALCNLKTMPKEPLAELCRTSIIRDETLAAFSVDIKETKRFALVRSALGTSAFEEVTTRRKSILDELRKRTKDAEIDYSAARQAVSTLVSELTEARAAVQQAADIISAQNQVAHLLEANDLPVGELLALARAEIARSRLRIENLVALRRQAVQLADDTSTLTAMASPEAVVALDDQITFGKREADRVAAELKRVRESLAPQENVNSRRQNLAGLYEHGKSLGLVDGACPLCRSHLSPEKFAAALKALETQLAETDLASAKGRIEFQELQTRSANAAANVRDLIQRKNAIAAERQSLADRVSQFFARGRDLGIEISESVSVGLIDQARSALEERLLGLESSTATLEASTALDRVTDLERKIEASQKISETLERRLRDLQAAGTMAKNLGDGVQRAVGEMLDERLAALDPLLQDLYSRLRPHVDWTELHYRLRGDVQRLLSLSVGDDVNPRFTFSSGQRRAMGLAFLLAVHLSRPWCKLKSLILDDPIQHIDDFRALHFVEVVSAIRRLGEQIICVVEDEGLAVAMCRRLRSAKLGDGALIEMAYSPGRGITVADVKPISPAVPNLVLTA